MFHYFGSGQNRRSHLFWVGLSWLYLLESWERAYHPWVSAAGPDPLQNPSTKREPELGARSLLLILTHKTSGRPNLVQCMLASWLAGWRLHLDGRDERLFLHVYFTWLVFFFSFLLVFGLWQLESAGAPLSSGFFFPPTQTTVQSPNCFT
jgi:hypothetical protein